MKKLRIFTAALILGTFSLLMVSSCEVFNPVYEEFELYGTWTLEDFSFDVDISGTNFGQVLLARLLVAGFKGELDEELQHYIDSLGGKVVFNEDYTYNLILFEEADTGTWMFNQDESSISLTAEETTINELQIEKLNADELILSYFLETGDVESDTTGNETIAMSVNIEVLFRKDL